MLPNWAFGPRINMLLFDSDGVQLIYLILHLTKIYSERQSVGGGGSRWARYQRMRRKEKGAKARKRGKRRRKRTQAKKGREGKEGRGHFH